MGCDVLMANVGPGRNLPLYPGSDVFPGPDIPRPGHVPAGES